MSKRKEEKIAEDQYFAFLEHLEDVFETQFRESWKKYEHVTDFTGPLQGATRFLSQSLTQMEASTKKLGMAWSIFFLILEKAAEGSLDADPLTNALTAFLQTAAYNKNRLKHRIKKIRDKQKLSGKTENFFNNLLRAV